ncbi:BI1-like protein [Canna indica]|uniref:BI1-like protein n=1 Tax=Canna indica TaxID=4628 RepID=A0AAQ3KWL7_9LILI|nr:BI1-like protein [Canna indica]
MTTMMHGRAYARVEKEKEKADGADLEAGWGPLHPGLSRGENELRWGFIRKVYGILATQILLTTAVSAATVLHPPISDALASSPGLALALAVLPLILICPMYHYRQKHPLNFVFLGLFTICLSLSIGVACANTQGMIVLEALILTCAVVASLMGYTFWASRKGKDFSYIAPFLFSALSILIVTSFLQMFFPLGSTSVAIFSGFGALVFSGFIIYDTEELIKRYTYDEYIWASVNLYLDILNLFISILNMLRSMQSDG